MQIWRPVILVPAFFLMMSLAVSIAGGENNKARWQGAAPNSGDSFRFIVMGDNTGNCIPGEWEEAIQECNRLKPDFVMSVGDLIEGGITNREDLTASWDAFDAKLRKLNAPFYYCIGNHDIDNRDMWLARYGVDGKSYYSFDYRGCHFVVLDDAWVGPDLMKAELAWLANDLASAADAKHVFVFYHVPLTDPPPPAIPGYPEFWGKLVKLFPAGKTTVFNGHWHWLSYSAPDGIPVYDVGPSGAYCCDPEGTSADILNRELGMFRMLTQVTVDNGTPTIAVIPLHEVLPGDYVLRSFSRPLIGMIQRPGTSSMSPRGGTFSLPYRNSLNAPFRASVSWDAPQWDVRPPVAETNIPPGESAVLTFALKPNGPTNPDFPDFPHYTVTYATTNPSGSNVSYRSVRTLPFCAEFDIPEVKGIDVDGKPGDWRNVKKYELKSKCRFVGGGPDVAWKYWQGEQDLSALICLGHDSRRLYVCLDVTDDQVEVGGKECWENDGIEFYWDSRPAAMQNGKHGLGTGQVILPVPPEGQAPVPSWYMGAFPSGFTGNRPIPKDFIAAVTRRPGGYTYEFSVPLSELGIKTPVTPGQTVRIEFMLNDRDLENGRLIQTHLTTSGQMGWMGTSIYAECTFK